MNICALCKHCVASEKREDYVCWSPRFARPVVLDPITGLYKYGYTQSSVFDSPSPLCVDINRFDKCDGYE